MPSSLYLFWDRLPFAGRLLFTATLVFVLAGTGMLYTTVRQDAQQADRTLSAELHASLETLPAVLAETLVIGDYATLQQTLDRYVRQADLLAIRYVDVGGVTITATDATQPTGAPGWFRNWVGLEDYTGQRHVEVGGRRYGSLSMRVTPEQAVARIWTRFSHHLTILALAIALEFMAIWYVLNHGLRPLRQLDESSRALAAGDLSSRIPVQGSPELRRSIGTFNAMAAALQDMLRQLRASNRALAEEKERAQVTLTSIGDGVITTDTDGNVDFLNPVAESLTGWCLAEARGHSLEEVFAIISEIDRKPAANPARRALAEGRVVGLANHTLLLSRDGREICIEDSAAPIRAEDGRIIGVVLVFHDVTNTRKMTQQLSWQAAHDALTDLVNRHEFERLLDHALHQAQEAGRGHALLYIDLDQFKVVNDTCGHAAGDELLRQLAGLMQHRLRGGDTLARLGGDEFGVLLMGCAAKDAERIAQDLQTAIREFRFTWEGRPFNVGASIGLVAVDGVLDTVGRLLAAADTACYAAKDQGRNRIQVWRAEDDELARRHGEMEWVSRIHEALENGRFELHAQRIAAIQTDGGNAGHFEILLRMRDREGRLVPPANFIPAAERYGLMHLLDRWVVSNVLQWLEARPAFTGVCAVNLSGQSLGDEDFLDFLRESLDGRRVDPARLCFEVTETAAIGNLSAAVAFMGRLLERGCRFALDDFGSGLSSFAYLKNLPVDYVKIDGYFVRDIAHDPIDRAMVEAIHTVSRAMSLVTIAEFVEDTTILDILKDIGVDYAQGYGIHRPEPLDQLGL